MGLLERLQRRDRARSADGPEIAVNLIRTRKLTGERGVVGGVQGREDPLDDVATGCTEVGDHPSAGRVAEAVVIHDDRGLPPVELPVGEIADARIPLNAIPVEAEEVRGLHSSGRVPCTRGAVDERLAAVLLRVVRDRDRFVTRQRADHHVRAELLHQPPRLLDRGIGLVVRAADSDELQRMPADAPSGPAGGRLALVLGLHTGVLRERTDRPADVLLVVGRERSLAVRKDRDLDRRGCARRRPTGSYRHPHRRRQRGGEDGKPGGKPEPAALLSHVRHVVYHA